MGLGLELGLCNVTQVITMVG